MEPELFKNTTIGEARKAKNALYYTFEPNRLPHRAVLENKTIKALSDSDRAVSLLSGLGLRLKNPNLIILPYIKKEALSSSKIEGTKTTLSHVFMKEAEDSPDDEDVDEQEVINYANALMWGLSQVTSGQAELTEEILFHMHHMLLRNVRGEDKDPGRYKSMPNFNGPSYDIMEADFVYTHPDSVPALMMNLVEYFNHNDDYPPLIQAAICHYQFEVIHPYRDGNGRIGRLLIMLYLCQKGVLSQALMYPSVFFEQNRRDYYDSLLKISTEGEVNQWLRFFLQGIKTQAEDAIIRLKKLNNIIIITINNRSNNDNNNNK